MTKVDMQQGLEFLRLHNQGSSYVDIGETFSLNNKTVRDWVKKAEGYIETQRSNDKGEDLADRYMQEHNQLVLAAGRGSTGRFLPSRHRWDRVKRRQCC